MTQAQQFEDLGAIKENVRFNEKTIDTLREDIKDVRQEIKDVRTEIKDVRGEIKDVRGEIKDLRGEVQELRAQISSYGVGGIVTAFVIILANVILKFFPS